MKRRSLIGLFAAGLALSSSISFAQEEESGTDGNAPEAARPGLPFAPAEKGMMPVKPQNLFTALPGQNRKWELKSSTGELALGEWLESRVIREFERIEEGDEEKRARTRITLTDTAKHPSTVEIFSEYEPGKEDEFEKEQEGYSQKIIETWPAFVVHFEAETEDEEDSVDIQMLVHGRFLVDFTLENQPEASINEWVQRCKFDVLKAIPDTEKIDLPEIVNIITIDQMNREQNRVYRLATTSGARLDRELAEDAEWIRRTIGEVPEIVEETEPN